MLMKILTEIGLHTFDGQLGCALSQLLVSVSSFIVSPLVARDSKSQFLDFSQSLSKFGKPSSFNLF